MVTFIFFVFFSSLIAPINIRAVIVMTDPLYIYNLSDPFARAIAYKESTFNPYAVNKHSKARGLFQFMPIMIDEVNKIQKRKEVLSFYIFHQSLNLKRYTWNDAFDPIKSIEMYYIVQQWKNPEYYYDKACRIWFGTGIQKHDKMRWEDYYNEVVKLLKQ